MIERILRDEDALVEGLRLITADRAIRKSRAVQTIW
jgi:hypothetical protein